MTKEFLDFLQQVDVDGQKKRDTIPPELDVREINEYFDTMGMTLIKVKKTYC